MSQSVETVIAPYILRPEQNIYLQSPFKGMIQQSTQSSISGPTLKKGLTKIARFLDSHQSETGLFTADIIHQAVYKASKKEKSDEADMSKYTGLSRLLRDLLRYPQIMDYIATQMSAGSYFDTGDLKESIKTKDQYNDSDWNTIDSYAWWAARKQTRLGRDCLPEVLQQGFLTTAQVRDLLKEKNDLPFLDREWLIMVNR